VKPADYSCYAALNVICPCSGIKRNALTAALISKGQSPEEVKRMAEKEKLNFVVFSGELDKALAGAAHFLNEARQSKVIPFI
jgi:hypothetical protein